MRVEVVDGETLVSERKRLLDQQGEDKYSVQVGLREVEFAFDERAAATLKLDPEMSSIEKAEAYLRQGILRPARFVEYDGTVHHVLKWDPTPMGYSGFMSCVIHSIVVTDQGTFEVGRYAAMNLSDFSKVWQWFIHRKLERD